MIIGSTSELSFAHRPDGLPAFAAAISASISRMSSERIPSGEMTSCRRFFGSR